LSRRAAAGHENRTPVAASEQPAGRELAFGAAAAAAGSAIVLALPAIRSVPWLPGQHDLAGPDNGLERT
jgi:hypothetical protein